MRFVLKLLAFLIFGPLILGLLLILGVVAIVGVPLLWEELVARFTAPPAPDAGTSSPSTSADRPEWSRSTWLAPNLVRHRLVTSSASGSQICWARRPAGVKPTSQAERGAPAPSGTISR